MSLAALSVAAAPLVPWWVIAAFAAVALLLVGFGVFRRARGVWWRALAIAVLLVTLANPSLVEERRDPQRDVAVVVADESPSQRIGDRARATEAAVAHLAQELQKLRDLDVRVVRAGKPGEGAPLGDGGTQLFTALNRTLADVPRQRLAGVAMVTDGQVHDVPDEEAARELGAPVHVLLSGKKGEADRRLVVAHAPSFGLVGKELTLTIRVEDLPQGAAPQGRARLTLRKDGGQPIVSSVATGRDVTVGVTIDHGGPNVVELEVEAGPQELTLDNNRAALVVNGVRDRLKVLLVSGEPHAGERTWRNILKSDPSVDLVHFTILRPPEKQDGTPIRELSLIAFPIRELFELKVDEFDLIIFDRYRRRGVLPNAYLENVVNYVRKGGALLEAAGPTFGTPNSLYRSPLGQILPTEPTGEIHEQGFKPRVTEQGLRHPVTADLPGQGKDGKDPSWGRWFRHVEARTVQGVPVMSGVGEEPLLVLGRVGEGRVAQLLSDHMWLWTRGFEGGGPQGELLRRLAYWLMKEPDLEENDLRASIEGDRLVVMRRSLEPDDRPVRVTGPDGVPRELRLEPDTGGRYTGAMPVTEPGLYRVTDGERTALAAAGALNPVEMSDVRTTEEKLAPVVEATGGGTFWVGDGALPDLRRVQPGRSAAGRNWIGFRANGDYVVTGVSETPLLPALAALLLALGTLLAAWRREGK
ncbi:MAG: hypothetical protein IRZ04_12525 [Rhodospirillales bacterium]|nr:hypothetical protein [Rhodospirillales bacterium]